MKNIPERIAKVEEKLQCPPEVFDNSDSCLNCNLTKSSPAQPVVLASELSDIAVERSPTNVRLVEDSVNSVATKLSPAGSVAKSDKLNGIITELSPARHSLIPLIKKSVLNSVIVTDSKRPPDQNLELKASGDVTLPGDDVIAEKFEVKTIDGVVGGNIASIFANSNMGVDSDIDLETTKDTSDDMKNVKDLDLEQVIIFHKHKNISKFESGRGSSGNNLNVINSSPKLDSMNCVNLSVLEPDSFNQKLIKLADKNLSISNKSFKNSNEKIDPSVEKEISKDFEEKEKETIEEKENIDLEERKKSMTIQPNSEKEILEIEATDEERKIAKLRQSCDSCCVHNL